MFCVHCASQILIKTRGLHCASKVFLKGTWFARHKTRGLQCASKVHINYTLGLQCASKVLLETRVLRTLCVKSSNIDTRVTVCVKSPFKDTCFA